MMQNNSTQVTDGDKRTSLETVLSFTSDQKESIFDGADLLQVFDKNSDEIRNKDKSGIVMTKEKAGDVVMGDSTASFPQGRYLEKSDSETNNDEKKFNDEISKSINKNKDDMVEYIDQPSPYDIICGRNSGAHNCVGNRRFRVTIMMNLQRYLAATTREEKSLVIKYVIGLLRDSDVGARFIKKVGETYIPLEEKQIREKVGHAFRDMISLSQKEAQKREASLSKFHLKSYR